MNFCRVNNDDCDNVTKQLEFPNVPSLEQKTQIFPPPAKMRASTSTIVLTDITEMNCVKKNEHSQSTFYLHDIGTKDIEKRKKWYSLFLPKGIKSSLKVKKEKKSKKSKKAIPELAM